MTRRSLIYSSPDAIAMLQLDRSYDDFPFQSAVSGRLKYDLLHSLEAEEHQQQSERVEA
ncbi:UNVERIFIED_CONTAM: hypothetical protein Sradi_2070500 [Sesamum radiatum]|uniref:Uncharacterized protein n=1 Tax=Sesamum radiatum TaxID=300843 RepID=A0AAW2THW6_SESRA